MSQDRPATGKSLQDDPRLQALLLGGWVLGWMVVESLIPPALSSRAILLALPLWTAALLLLASKEGPRVTGLMASPRVAILLMTALLLGLLAGALSSGPQTSGLATFLQLGRVTESLWFASLLLLLALSALLAAWQQRPWTLARLGLLALHTGPAILFLAALWSRVDGVRGLAIPDPAGAVASFVPRGSQRVASPAEALPFRLQVTHVQTEAPEPSWRLVIHRTPDGAGGFRDTPRGLEVAEGQTLAVTGTDLEVQILRSLPDAVENGLVEDPEAPAEPVLQVMVGLGQPRPLIGQLVPSGAGSRREVPGGHFAVLFRAAWDPRLLEELRSSARGPGRLVVTTEGRAFAAEARAGASLEVPGGRYRVREVFPDFIVATDGGGPPQPSTRSPRFREPWLQVERLAADGSVTRLLASARSPALSDGLNAPHLPPDTTVRYVLEEGETQRRFVVLTAADRNVRFVVDGREVRRAPLVLGNPFIVEAGRSVTPLALLAHAAPDFTARPADAPPVTPRRPALKVRVFDRASGRAETRWLDGRGPDGQPSAAALLGGRLGLVLRPEAAPPSAHRAQVTVQGLDGLVRSTTFVAGHPLILEGWRVQLLPPEASGPRAAFWVERGSCAWAVPLGLAWLGFGALALLFPGRARRPKDTPTLPDVGGAL